jgi:hypothetical protein
VPVVVPNVRKRDRKLTPVGPNWQRRNSYHPCLFAKCELPNIPVYRHNHVIVATEKCKFDVASAVVESTGAAVTKSLVGGSTIINHWIDRHCGIVCVRYNVWRPSTTS